MNFRTAVLLGSMTLAIGLIVAVTIGMGLMIERATHREASAGLSRTRHTFEALQTFRQTLFGAQSQVLAEEPRLKAAVATEDVTPETILEVAGDLQRFLQADLLIVTDAEGQLLSNPRGSEAMERLARQQFIQSVLARGESSDVWIDGERAFQLHARRLESDTRTVGVVLLGYLLDDHAAQAMSDQIASPVVLTLDGKVLATSTLEGGSTVDHARLAEELAPSLARESNPTEVRIDGHPYLALSAPLPGYHGSAALRFTVLRSLNEALATGRLLTRFLLLLMLVGGSITIFLAIVLSDRLSRPLVSLAGFTQQVARGDYTARAVPRGTTELRGLAEAMNLMVEEVDKSHKELALKERLEKEMEIAAHLQTAILPRELKVEGLEIAARMIPATEVGGDYYDVLPVPSGAYIGIGDVAGHGLTAGVVMLMIQNAMAALVRDSPEALPRDLVCRLNDVIYENIRKRMRRNEHATLSVLRYHPDGKVVYAGAHEELIICRAATGRCERLPVSGTWVGAMRSVEPFTEDVAFELHPGDLLVLYSDGITEAMDATGEQFGMDRLCSEIEKRHQQPVEQLCRELLDVAKAWTVTQADDMTAMIIRYQGPPGPAARA